MSNTECDPRFALLLREMDREALDHAPEVIYGVWPDLTLAYANERWGAFALENGSPEILARWSLGTSLRAATGEALGPFYERFFAQALDTNQPGQHIYACPSPREQRWFCLRALPVRSEGLLLCHSLVALTTLEESGSEPPNLQLYRDEAGLVGQCCHCRRVRLAMNPRLWHFVPAFVEKAPPGTSHGLCPICVAYHYEGVLTPGDLRAIIDSSMRAAASEAAHAA